MGNSEDWVTIDNSFANEKDFLANLITIDDGENSNEMLELGRFKIYRFITQPYEMIMKHVRIFAPDNPKYVQYSDIAKSLASHIDHKNIAKIHSINICTRSNLCIKQISIESYVNYYAINLQQIIDQRKSNDIRFTSGELWYILNSLLQLSLYLKNLSIYFGIYLAKNIYLSPEGYIKIYLYHLSPQNKHQLYYHMISSDCREMHKFLPLPPECLPSLKLRVQDLINLNFEKLQVFGIAMIALEAMLFNSTRRYYINSSSNQYAINFDEKQFKIDLRELKQIYPSNLTNLIDKMVKIDPKDRISLQQAKNFIKSNRQDISINGSIKMIDDEDNPILPKISYKNVHKEQECTSILKSITNNGESRLQFVPIRPISKQKYSSCGSQYKSLTISQIGLSIGHKKENKLNLSNMTATNSISRRQQSSRAMEGKYLSSFR